MQSAGFRRLDFQIDEEIFGRRAGAVVPRYSADRAAAEQVVRRVRLLYPEWKFTMVEDLWGYTATWQCPGRPVSPAMVTLGSHRSPTMTVAMTRASLVAVQNMKRYEERRRMRIGAPADEVKLEGPTLERKQSG
jgi:hypothetical protein